jgi:uncharacterized lipoprotein YmbA
MSLRRSLLLAAAALALAGCAAPPVRYFTLAGTPTASTAPVVAANAVPVHIEIAPVGVPERLARPQLVIRSGADNPRNGGTPRLEVLEQQRWTSAFDSELRDAFAGAISTRAGAVDVTRGGRLPGQPVYRVAIRVRYLDATLDRQVDAGYGWTITRSDDSRSALCQSSLSQPVGAGLEQLVLGIQQTVDAAAQRIAHQIQQLQNSGNAVCDPATTPSSPSAGVAPEPVPAVLKPAAKVR